LRGICLSPTSFGGWEIWSQVFSPFAFRFWPSPFLPSSVQKVELEPTPTDLIRFPYSTIGGVGLADKSGKPRRRNW
jgi:hypothetical protein